MLKSTNIDEMFYEGSNESIKKQTLVNDMFSPKLEKPNIFQVTSPTEEDTSTFDYLYEFSETRKVLEEFFKTSENDKIKEFEKFSDCNESNESLVSAFAYFIFIMLKIFKSRFY
jgi:hypothetical protein